jgi:cobalt/nickel transport system permease protein
MRHSTLDAYARSSRFHSLDPRMKFLSLLILIIVTSFITSPVLLLLTLSFTLILLALSRVPVPHLVKHYGLALPFICFSALSLALTSGIMPAFSLYLRTSTAVLLLLLLGSTTPFFELLRGLQGLHIPSTYIIMLFFIYRDIFIIWDELHRMEQARIARGHVQSGTLRNRHFLQTITGTAGMVLIRSYQRGIRSYRALLSRGFQGQIHTLRAPTVNRRDFHFAFLMILFSSSIALLHFEVVPFEVIPYP